MNPVSVIIPACNEERLIGRCIDAVIGSRGVAGDIIVAANGCRDDTAGVARSLAARARERGWQLTVLELREGGKPAALNAADARATGAVRAYLDADVTIDADLIAQSCAALAGDAPGYASGRLRITAPGAGAARHYARFWAGVPFMAQGVPGCGYFAVNAAGRARWGTFPALIADDVFVRLQFAPSERHLVAAGYDWPVAPTWRALVRVRRRQDRGVREIAARYPELMRNDDKQPAGAAATLRRAAADPLGFAVYGSVAAAVRIAPAGDTGWSRSR